MMAPFSGYARFYDLFYGDKDYKKEVDYVDRLIKRYSTGRARSLLDVGCGTGKHDLWFSKKGYNVTGVDRSPEMISIAKERSSSDGRTRFHACPADRFSFNTRFDAAVSLFHVMNYLTETGSLLDSLKNIRRHLKKGGLFIFDFWYGPAVLKDRPARRTKVVRDGERLVRRTATPKVDVNSNTVGVLYEVSTKEPGGVFKKNISTYHNMRYFFLPELYLMLKISGFKPVSCLKWMSAKDGLREDSWAGVMIARR